MKLQRVLLIMLLPTPAFAGEVGSGDLMGSWVRMIIALLVVIGIILLLYALSRKGFGFLPAARGGVIKVIEMRSLGPKKGVCLIRVRDEEYLLGLGGERVELIAPIRRSEQSFADTLEDKMGGPS